MSSSIICWLGPEPALCSVNFSRGRRSLILLNYFKAPEILASASRRLLLEMARGATGPRSEKQSEISTNLKETMQ